MKRFPKSIFYIIANEFAERFSYYGYRALLTPFLVVAFAMSREEAAAVTHENIVFTYATPVIGGLLADWLIGKYRTILYVSLVYCVGHLLLALYIDDLMGFRAGLLLIAIGAGMLKPNSSSLMGDQFPQGTGALLTKAFNWYYFAINMGSFLAFLIIPELKAFGYEWAFAVPGILMGIATIVLYLGRKTYVMVPPTGLPKYHFLSLNWQALRMWMKGERQVWKTLGERIGEERVDGTLAVWRVLGFFAFFPLAWALYDMSSAEWILDAEHLDRNLFGFVLKQEQVQAFNPILILTLIPVVLWLEGRLAKRGFKIKPQRKVFVGFALVGLATVVEGFVRMEIEAGGHPPVAFQLLAYLILTVGEVLFYITGLELGYRASPRSMKSTITSFFLLTNAAGNFLAAQVNRAMASGGWWSVLKEGANFYWFFLALLGLNLVAYLLVVPRMKMRIYD